MYKKIVIVCMGLILLFNSVLPILAEQKKSYTEKIKAICKDMIRPASAFGASLLCNYYARQYWDCMIKGMDHGFALSEQFLRDKITAIDPSLDLNATGPHDPALVARVEGYIKKIRTDVGEFPGDSITNEAFSNDLPRYMAFKIAFWMLIGYGVVSLLYVIAKNIDDEKKTAETNE